jgi:hypothetical protein
LFNAKALFLSAAALQALNVRVGDSIVLQHGLEPVSLVVAGEVPGPGHPRGRPFDLRERGVGDIDLQAPEALSQKRRRPDSLPAPKMHHGRWHLAGLPRGLRQECRVE